MGYKSVWFARMSEKGPFIARISGIPSHGYQEDRLVVFSAILICSGNERRAEVLLDFLEPKVKKFGLSRTLQMPQATVHSSLWAEA
jgi:hypothetical protein